MSLLGNFASFSFSQCQMVVFKKDFDAHLTRLKECIDTHMCLSKMDLVKDKMSSLNNCFTKKKEI